jgi:methyltransferase-like protein
MSTELRKAYDAFPYESYPFAQSHPDRLATVAWLFGMDPAPVEKCRLLEIGCSSGGNLLPMAVSLSDSEFVGIDLSPVQIGRGRADVEALGLANIRLLEMDLMDVSDNFGTFDYIIAHGVYSWMPALAQERLFEICRRHLACLGVAYISYNALPGWRMRSIVRDAMIYHTRGAPDPKMRVAQARAMLDFLAESTKDDVSPYAALLRSEAQNLHSQPDYYLVHEHLEPENHPEYFHRFAERAARHDLAYLGESDFGRMLGNEFGPEVKATLARVAPDLIRREQYMDFLRNRTFRESLLVRSGVDLNRKVSPMRLTAMRVGSKARSASEAPVVDGVTVEQFRLPDGKGFSSSVPITKAAFVVLAQHWPINVAFEDLYAEARALLSSQPDVSQDSERALLASELLWCYSAGYAELHRSASRYTTRPGERPEADALARLQAARGPRVTNLRHELTRLDDEGLRRLCMALDGTRTQEELMAAPWAGGPAGDPKQALEAGIWQLAQRALLVR